MSLTKFNESVTNHQSLPDKPTQSSTDLKILFDKVGVDIKNYLNQTLTEELDSIISEFQTNINNMLDSVYPIGSIYMSVNNTNPSSLFGGTWVAWGSGKVPVGFNADETEFNEAEKTGGEKSHQLSVNEMPTHSHTFHGYSHNHNLNGHTHNIPALSGYTDWKDLEGNFWNVAVQSNTSGVEANGICQTGWGSPGGAVGYAVNKDSQHTGWDDTVRVYASHSHNVTTYANTTGQAWDNTSDTTVGGYNDNNGGNQAHNNLQPYITCYMWKRTA